MELSTWAVWSLSPSFQRYVMPHSALSHQKGGPKSVCPRQAEAVFTRTEQSGEHTSLEHAGLALHRASHKPPHLGCPHDSRGCGEVTRKVGPRASRTG